MGKLDTTAWVKRGILEKLGAISGFTNGKLTQFNRGLFEEYLYAPYAEAKWGYACSDHIPWERA